MPAAMSGTASGGRPRGSIRRNVVRRSCDNLRRAARKACPVHLRSFSTPRSSSWLSVGVERKRAEGRRTASSPLAVRHVASRPREDRLQSSAQKAYESFDEVGGRGVCCLRWSARVRWCARADHRKRLGRQRQSVEDVPRSVGRRRFTSKPLPRPPGRGLCRGMLRQLAARPGLRDRRARPSKPRDFARRKRGDRRVRELFAAARCIFTRRPPWSRAHLRPSI